MTQTCRPWSDSLFAIILRTLIVAVIAGAVIAGGVFLAGGHR